MVEGGTGVLVGVALDSGIGVAVGVVLHGVAVAIIVAVAQGDGVGVIVGGDWATYVTEADAVFTSFIAPL